MKRILLLFSAAILLATGVLAAPNPIIGTWRLDSQEVNGATTNAEPLTLKVAQDGDNLAFAFSVPVNDVYFVSMTYSVKVDGGEADVKNAHGDKVGTVRMTAAGPSQYMVTLKGVNRPGSSGKLTVSPDGRTLTSEQDTAPAGSSGRPIHSKQIFSRY